MSFKEYESYDAMGLAALVRGGEISESELLEAALQRMESRNPELNAVVVPMEAEARAAIERGLPDGALRGVPFLLKDLAVLYEGTVTSNGSRFFAGRVADHDSELVARYKRAGLVVFGKSASPEFGLCTTTESQLYGLTRNPWNTEYTAGGSSGGAAAAVAGGLLPAAHASDGGGSIRIPASCCGLFGLKPSRGRMPMGPDVGEAWSGMTTLHAVTRSVRDSALLLDLTSGPDLGAPYQAAPKTRPYLEEVGEKVGQLRVGLLRETFNGKATHPDCRAAVEAAIELCEGLGHRVEERALQVDVAKVGRAAQTIMASNLVATLEDRGEILGRSFGQEDLEPFTFAMTQAVRSHTAVDYARAIGVIHRVGRQVEGLFGGCDLLLSPTMAAPPCKLGVLSLSNPNVGQLIDSLTTSVGYTQIFNASGHPAMSVPLYWNGQGLPIGVQFAAPLGGEAGLIRFAAQLEQAQPWFDRRPE